MRACGLLLVLVACQAGPTFSLSVQHRAPAGPATAVKQTVVTVYAGADVTCDAIKWGDRSESELAAIAAEEVDVSKGGELELARLGGKAIVARGYDATGRYVAAGCADVGALTGDTHVTIATQPTAVVAIDPGAPDQVFADRTLLVNVSDAAGRALDRGLIGADALVSWQLTGPAGTPDPPPAAGVDIGGKGDARFKADDLGVVGPEALRLRVAWATSRLPPVTAFDLAHASAPIALPGTVPAHVSCDVRGHAGRAPTLVCLTQASATGHRDAVELAWQTDHYATTPIPIPPTLDNQYALFVDHDGSADEPVYVIGGAGTAGTWYKLGTPAAAAVAITLGGPLQAVVYIARCKQNAVTALVGVESGVAAATEVRYYTPAGVQVGAGPAPGEVFAGGCVADVDKVEHQAVVAVGLIGDPALYVLAGGTQIAVGTSKLTGSGFITSVSQGMTEARFAGTRLQASGTVVFQAVLAPEGAGFKLVERSEVEAAGPPVKIVAAKLDQDGDTDLIWDIAIARRRMYQVALAKQVDGAALSAITSGPANASTTASGITPDFYVADLNGHGAAELILVGPAALTIFTPD